MIDPSFMKFSSKITDVDVQQRMRLEMFKEAENVLHAENDHVIVEEKTSDMVEIALETKEMEMQRRKYQPTV